PSRGRPTCLPPEGLPPDLQAVQRCYGGPRRWLRWSGLCSGNRPPLCPRPPGTRRRPGRVLHLAGRNCPTSRTAPLSVTQPALPAHLRHCQPAPPHSRPSSPAHLVPLACPPCADR